jgi:hypothetical protein
LWLTHKPSFATLLGFHLFFSLGSLETVGYLYGFGHFFSPNCSISSYCACFQFSNFYGTGSSATAHCGGKFVIATINHGGNHMNKEMIAEAPRATTFTLYLPKFLREYSLSEQSLEEQKNELMQKDWLTSGLIHEIHSLYPTCSEIKTDDDNKRDPTAFEHKISQLFPPGRIFASFKQLDQAADVFLGLD